MRDPARIEAVLDALRSYWQANPDLRLGQIVENAGRNLPYSVFYMEDDVLMAYLKQKTKDPFR